MSILYIVATPIGNLDDITYRAIETLKSVDVILCEDTRVTRNLLDRYEIKKPTISYHSQSKLSKTDHIIELLSEGKNLALVSDAGTPTISDPGVVLVAKVREVLGDDVTIIPIPGPAAFIAALSVSGLPTHEFMFLGFLPHKKGRQTLFKEIADSERTTVFYESPHRFTKALESLSDLLAPDRKIAVGRELTKIYEEIKVGTILEIIKYYTDNSDKVRGEFVIIVSPR